MRSATLGQIVAGLTGILEEIKAADGDRIQIVGWRGQEAHTPPSAWLNLQPGSTGGDRTRLIDRLPFELWLTRPPADTNNNEIADLAALADLAIPIVDGALAKTQSRTRLGVDVAKRDGFAFRTADQADGDGSTLTAPALLIPVIAEWPATQC